MPAAIRGKWLYPAALLFILAAAWWVETVNLLRAMSGGPDEGIYLGSARLLNYGYPFRSFFFDQFALFPQILALALRLGGDSVLTGRLTIVLFSISALLGLALLTRTVSTRAAAISAIPLAVANPFFLEQSRFVMAEVPAIAFMLWALVVVTAFTSRHQRRWLVVGAVLCAASLLIKPLTIGLALPVVWWLIAGRIVREPGRRALRWRELTIDLTVFLGTGIITGALFVNLADLGGEFQRTVGFHLQETTIWAADVSGRIDGVVGFFTENRACSGLALTGTLFALVKKPGRALPLILAEGATVLVLLQLSSLPHYYALLAPLLALFSAVGLFEGATALVHILRLVVRVFPTSASALGQKLANPAPLGRFTALLSVIFLAAAAVWIHDAPELARHNLGVLRKTSHNTTPTVLFLRQRTAPGDFLISDDPMVVFRAGCLIPPSAINLSYASTFRFFKGSQRRLEESVRDYHVKAFAVLGPFNANFPLMKWIATNYPVERIAGQEGTVGSALTFWRE